MSIKSIVSKIASHFLTRDELTALCGESTLQELVNKATQTMHKVSTDVDSDSMEYHRLAYASEAFVLKTHKVFTLTGLAVKHIAMTKDKAYFIEMAIKRIAEEYYIANSLPVDKDCCDNLIHNVKESLVKAAGITNFIQRRSVVRNAVKLNLPGIDSDRSAALVELLLQLP